MQHTANALAHAADVLADYLPAPTGQSGWTLANALLDLREDDAARLAAALIRCIDAAEAVRKALGAAPEGEGRASDCEAEGVAPRSEGA